MLSLNDGTELICVQCFEKVNGDMKHLDSHDHAPFSPKCYVPYHPFTKKYMLTQKITEESGTPTKKDREESGSSWTGSGSEHDSDSDSTTKTPKKSTTTPKKRKHKVTVDSEDATASEFAGLFDSAEEDTSVPVPQEPNKRQKITGDSEDGDSSECEDDGIVLDEALLQTEAVQVHRVGLPGKCVR